jgi:hypothetical protein
VACLTNSSSAVSKPRKIHALKQCVLRSGKDSVHHGLRGGMCAFAKGTSAGRSLGLRGFVPSLKHRTRRIMMSTKPFPPQTPPPATWACGLWSTAYQIDCYASKVVALAALFGQCKGTLRTRLQIKKQPTDPLNDSLAYAATAHRLGQSASEMTCHKAPNYEDHCCAFRTHDFGPKNGLARVQRLHLFDANNNSDRQ